MVKRIIQKQKGNPMAFYAKLEEAFRNNYNLDPESVEEAALLSHHFVNQSAPDTRQKL
jgi:hypothetical protein